MLLLKYAAIFHGEVEDRVDMERMTEQMKQRLTCRFDLKEKEGFEHRMFKAAVGQKLCQSLKE